MERAIIKFNGGRLALLCHSCRVIIKTGIEFNEQEEEYALGKSILEPQFCESCKTKKKDVKG